MSESKDNNFDAKKWSSENGHLAKKAFEKWKEENPTPEQKDSDHKPPSK